MKTRRMLTAVTFSLFLVAAAVPALADWEQPVDGLPSSTSVNLAADPLLQAAVLGLQAALVAF